MKKVFLIIFISLISIFAFGENPTISMSKTYGVKIYEGIYRGESPNGNPLCEAVSNVPCCIVVTPATENPRVEIYSLPTIIKTIQNAIIDSTVDNVDETYECIITYLN